MQLETTTQPCLDWPKRDHRSEEGYVYLLAHSTGIVKVGATKGPRERAQRIRANAAEFGVSITRGWLSPRHADYAATEERVLRHAFSIGQPTGGEYVRCSFGELVTYAANLTPAPTATLGRPIRRRCNLEKPPEYEAARQMRRDGATYREIAAALGIALGRAHAYCASLN